MSKMSEIAMELDDQAGELGFESYEEAIACGYEIDAEALSNGVARLCIDREQEEAHEAWIKERDEILERLNKMSYDITELMETLSPKDYTNWTETLEKTVKFIEKGEC